MTCVLRLHRLQYSLKTKHKYRTIYNYAKYTLKHSSPYAVGDPQHEIYGIYPPSKPGS